jgi:hypothetical protein
MIQQPSVGLAERESEDAEDETFPGKRYGLKKRYGLNDRYSSVTDIQEVGFVLFSILCRLHSVITVGRYGSLDATVVCTRLCFA